jgi:hypothetical protein
MIEIPYTDFFDLIDNKEFIDAIKILRNDGKLDVLKTSYSNKRAQFIFADEKEELVFKLKYSNLLANE